MRRPKSQRTVELLVLTAAATVGLVWALPAAGIGLTLGFCLMAQGLDPRPLVWVARRAVGAIDDGDARSGPAAPSAWSVSFGHALWVAAIAVGCGVVAYLGERDVLGVGYAFVPAVVPFLLLAFAVPGVLRGGSARTA